MTQPWAVDPKLAGNAEGVSIMVGFRGTKDQPADLAELEQEYCRLTHQPYPIQEMVFARSWMLFRVSATFYAITLSCSSSSSWLSLRKASQHDTLAAKPAQRRHRSTRKSSHLWAGWRRSY